MSDKMKTLMEGWRQFSKELNEEADPAKLDPKRFPMKLGQVSKKIAQRVTRSGDDRFDKSGNDDVIPVRHVPEGFPVSKLMPSQSSMLMEKAMAFVIHMLWEGNEGLAPGGDLGAFIANDPGGLYIMDGHHRWIATGMIDPTLKMGGYLVDFPAPQLLAVLNSITAGLLGITKGKKASGGFNQFTPQNVDRWLRKYAAEGKWGATPEDVMGVIQKYTGLEGEEAITAMSSRLAANLKKLTLSVPSWAPARPQMPVIDKDMVAGAISRAVRAMKSGSVDVNPPYGYEVGGGEGSEGFDQDAAREAELEKRRAADRRAIFKEQQNEEK